MHKICLVMLFIGLGLSANGQKYGLEVRDTAPTFSGIDQFDSIITSQAILDSADNYVLIFYRGSWCSYCRKHVSNFSDSLSLILAKNTTVIVITPEIPKSKERMESETGATFSIISDTTYKIMDAFGVSFKISKKTVPKYRENVTRLTKKSNGNVEGILPIPATFIVGKNGTIKWKHVDVNYTNRSTVKQILHEL